MSKKKYLIALYAMVAIWLATFAQIIINEIFIKEDAIIEAFSFVEMDVTESHLEVTACYDSAFLTDSEKEELLKHLAAGIGLTDNYHMSSILENGKKLSKIGNSADISISFVNDKDKMQYIHFQLNLYDDADKIIYYKNRMEEQLKKIGVKDWQTILGLQSMSQGRIPENELDKLSEEVLKTLDASPLNKHSEGSIYTIYAYTSMIKEYLTINGEKVNVHIVARYNEAEDKTIFYLSTPILNEDF